MRPAASRNPLAGKAGWAGPPAGCPPRPAHAPTRNTDGRPIASAHNVKVSRRFEVPRTPSRQPSTTYLPPPRQKDGLLVLSHLSQPHRVHPDPSLAPAATEPRLLVVPFGRHFGDGVACVCARAWFVVIKKWMIGLTRGVRRSIDPRPHRGRAASPIRRSRRRGRLRVSVKAA